MQKNSIRSVRQNDSGNNGVPHTAAGAFVETNTAREIWASLDLAAKIGGVALIFGPTGTGKSEAVKHYASQRERGYVVTMAVSDCKPVPVLSKIAASCNLECSLHHGARDITDMISRQLGPGAVLVVDNAEHLPPALLLSVANFAEVADGCAVALVGRERLHSLIFAGKAARSRFDMESLASRTAPVRYVKSVSADDVAAFADAYGVADREARSLLEQVAAKPSAPNRLWALTRVLRLAQEEAKAGPVRSVHIRNAARILGDLTIGA